MTMTTLLSTTGRAVFGSASETQHALVSADSSIRAAVATSRRIGFVHLAGGVGCSSVAAAVVSSLASRRGGRVLAVDGGGGRAGLGLRIGSVADASSSPRRESSRSSEEEAIAGLARTDGGAAFLPLGVRDSAVWPVALSDWQTEVTGIARYFDFVVTDWGRRRDLDEIAPLAATGQAIAIVTSSDRPAIEEAARIVPALHEGGTGVVLVVTDVGREGESPVGLDLEPLTARVVRLPHLTAWRTSTGQVPSRALSARQRGPLIAVTAAVVDAALGRPPGGRAVR